MRIVNRVVFMVRFRGWLGSSVSAPSDVGVGKGCGRGGRANGPAVGFRGSSELKLFDLGEQLVNLFGMQIETGVIDADLAVRGDRHEALAFPINRGGEMPFHDAVFHHLHRLHGDGGDIAACVFCQGSAQLIGSLGCVDASDGVHDSNASSLK